MENLFSYGTLQLEKIQDDVFQRLLSGKTDTLRRYKTSRIAIQDRQYLIVDFTGDESDVVGGMVFEVTTDELTSADEYEGSDYRRVEVMLESGNRAWVYVRA